MKYIKVNGIQSKCYLANENGEIFNVEGRKLSKHRGYNDYDRVKLNRDIPRGMYSVHRVIAETFLDIPEGKNIVNHKNNIRYDNRLCNLEWCNNSENQKQRFRSGHKGTKRVAIEQVNCETGEVVAIWDSAIDAEKATGIARQNISKVCTGNRPRAGGYSWRYKQDNN